MPTIRPYFRIARPTFIPRKFSPTHFLALLATRVAESSNVAGNRVPCAVIRTFNELAGEFAAAHRASNAGMRLATQTTDATTRPVVSIEAVSDEARFPECRLQSAGSK